MGYRHEIFPHIASYVSSNDNEVVFPFHPHCMTVLEKAFQWSSSRSQGPEERSRLDLNVLYKTAVRIGGLGNLKLDYGGIHGVDQCWESIPGEEVRRETSSPISFERPLTGSDSSPLSTPSNSPSTLSTSISNHPPSRTPCPSETGR